MRIAEIHYISDPTNPPAKEFRCLICDRHRAYSLEGFVDHVAAYHDCSSDVLDYVIYPYAEGVFLIFRKREDLSL